MPDHDGMLRRQKILADFGEFTLSNDDLDQVLTEACRLVAAALGTARAKVLEIQQDGQSLLVRAGVGWAPEVVGQVHLPMDERSSETYSIKAGKPVITRDINQEDRFVVPAFMREAGVVALVNVPIRLPGGKAYGLLQVDDIRPREFGEEDTEFLRTYATILGPVIDRLFKLRDLRASEERFRLTAEEARDYLIFMMDQDGRITDWLPGATAVLGWSAKDAVGKPFSMLFAPEDGEQNDHVSELEQARREGHAPDIREHLHKDGSKVFIEGSLRALRDESGVVTGFLKIGQDVTERLGAEARLRESEERFRSFAENSADVLWIADRTATRLEYLSPAFERTFGVDRDGVMAEFNHWRDMIFPEDRDAELGFLPRVVAGEVALVHYRVVRPKDGQIVHLRDTAFPVRDGDGAIIRVAGVVQDVSDIARAGEALEAEKERFRILAEGIPQLVWRSGDDGLWTWSSPQWQHYTGQSQTESHGWGWLDTIHPDDREATMQAWHEARPHGRLDMEYRVRRATDGVWRWHQTRSVPVRGMPGPGEVEGRILEWLGTTTDIDDLKRLQGQQQVLVAELQHRTRNLLAVVRNVARRSIDPSPGRDEYDARLGALGRVQGFLSRSPAYSVPLADVVNAELEAAGNGASAKVVVQGPPVDLPGEGVQAVALALHELATNAVKYGAITQAAGRLSVIWRVEAGDATNGRRLVIDWWESGVVMPPGPPSRRGYGSELITRALPYQLHAETLLEFNDDGVHCRIALPASAFSVAFMEEPT